MTHPAETFRRLHERKGAFIIPNPWDVGSSRILARMGFEALATTSAGFAFGCGQIEGTLAKEDVLGHCREIVGATPLPVSADLEKGFGDSPESAFDTIVAAAGTGLAGGSIEDHTGDRKAPIFDKTLATERVRAACEARDSLDHDFVLTARCENLLWGKRDMDDVIARLEAYEAAGADVLYAPGLRDLETIGLVCEALSKPVNVVMGLPGVSIGLADLEACGVKRVSVGSALFRAAYGALVRAGEEMASKGTFGYSDDAIGFGDLEAFFRPPKG